MRSGQGPATCNPVPLPAQSTPRGSQCRGVHLAGCVHPHVAQMPGLVVVAGDPVEHPGVAHHESEAVGVGLGPHRCRLIGERGSEAVPPAAVSDVEGPAGLVFRIAGPRGGGVPRSGLSLRLAPTCCRCSDLGVEGSVAAREGDDDAGRRGRCEHLLRRCRRRAVEQRRFAGAWPGARVAGSGRPVHRRRGRAAGACSRPPVGSPGR